MQNKEKKSQNLTCTLSVERIDKDEDGEWRDKEEEEEAEDKVDFFVVFARFLAATDSVFLAGGKLSWCRFLCNAAL